MMKRPNRYLVSAAERAASRPYYLGYALRLYRGTYELTEDQLADFIHCSRAELPSLALCRRPGEAGMDFQNDLKDLASRYGVDRYRLARVVRHAENVDLLRSPRSTAEAEPFLLAAHDRDDDDPPSNGAAPNDDEGDE